MNDVFREASERVSAQEAARLYGLTFDRRGWALCPFHPDTVPSMSFRDGRFRCWACNESGDSIDFTARLFGISAMDAVRQLNADFGLLLPLDRVLTPAEQKQAARRRELRKIERSYNAWREKSINHLDRCCRAANRALARCRDDLTETEALAIRSAAMLEYWSDILQSGTVVDVITIFRDRKEVEYLYSRILNDTQTKSKTA